MKKIVTITLVFFFISMGIMSLWGFIDKQSKEAATPTPTASTSSSTNGNTANSTNTNTSQPTNSAGTYTMSDLSKHNKSSDCWLDIAGNVYDVTQYLDYHPGGADIIIMYCGLDATSAYNTKGGRRGPHSSRADSILAGYKIGTIK